MTPVKEIAARGYAALFARPGKAQAVNHALFHLALRGMGSNNGWQLDRSGEQWFIRHVLAPTNPVTCIDVGANRGDYSGALLQHTGAQVIAFEPLVGCRPALDAVAARYPGRLQIIAEAVGAEPGVLDIHFGDADSEWASLSTDVNGIGYVGAANTRSEPVTVTTLDSRLADADRIDFIKIDVEGYEYEVLAGAQQLIAARRPRFVQVEQNLHSLFTGHTLRSIGALLPGYRAHQLLPRGMRPVDLDRPEPNIAVFGNFIFEKVTSS